MCLLEWKTELTFNDIIILIDAEHCVNILTAHSPKAGWKLWKDYAHNLLRALNIAEKFCINKINNRPFKCLPSGEKVDIKYTNELEEKLLKRFYRGLEPWPFRSNYALSKPLTNSASKTPNVDNAQSKGQARLWYDDPCFLPKLIAKNIPNWTNLKTVDPNQTTLVKFFLRETYMASCLLAWETTSFAGHFHLQTTDC